MNAKPLSLITEVVEVCNPEALSTVVQWLADERGSTRLITGYDLENSLDRIVATQGPVDGLELVQHRWRQRDSQVDRTPIWMIEVRDLFEQPSESFAAACREHGLDYRALSGSARTACQTMALASGLLAGRDHDNFTWDKPVRLDAVLKSAIDTRSQR
ncbi:hypothetical protein [Nocardia noduli]|uniref:hypothetical protein n=1 Tax=Nocardia noduli TaxID=2815722 RepID=UPI001C23628C|nr:hypothetical protein [Nocardia noduli]